MRTRMVHAFRAANLFFSGLNQSAARRLVRYPSFDLRRPVAPALSDLLVRRGNQLLHPTPAQSVLALPRGKSPVAVPLTAARNTAWSSSAIVTKPLWSATFLFLLS